jgi:hypothetical protein
MAGRFYANPKLPRFRGGSGFHGLRCLDQGAAGVESHVQEVFAPGTATYTIEAARLTIERDSTGIAATTE